MNVLIAVDASEPHFSKAIINFVHSHHWPEKSTFRVLNVIDPFEVEFYSSYIETQKIEEELQAAALSSTNELADRLRKSMPAEDITAQVSLGHPSETILEHARSWPADIVVLGSHGRRGFNRLILGSVSSAVASNSPCSVVVVSLPNNEESEKIRDAENKMRILVPVAEKEFANLVCSFLCQHELQPGTEIQILYVLEPLLVGSPLAFLPGPKLNEMKDKHLEAGATLIGVLTADLQSKLMNVKVAKQIIEGIPTDTILEVAADWQADWICLGSHARRGLKRLLLGSVSMGVLHRAKCTTLIMHAPALDDSTSHTESDK